MDSIDIRLLSRDDLAVLDDVDPDVFDHPVQPAHAARFLASPDNLLVVAIDNRQVVGMASGTIYSHPDKPLQLFVNEVGVADRCQGQGIGRRLMGFLLAQARSLGCAEAWVGTEEDNTRARALYRAVGGREEPERAVIYTWSL